MKFSVVIVNYNVKYYLEQCLCSLYRAIDNLSAEIFVVDNASVDDSEAYLTERFPRELSGGELQRFCVARALMSGADYLICDEISTMLDVITQAQIWRVVLAEAEKRNMGIIAVTHNKHLAERIATRTIDLSAV